MEMGGNEIEKRHRISDFATGCLAELDICIFNLSEI
jgi:hypothetical protein